MRYNPPLYLLYFTILSVISILFPPPFEKVLPSYILFSAFYFFQCPASNDIQILFLSAYAQCAGVPQGSVLDPVLSHIC